MASKPITSTQKVMLRRAKTFPILVMMGADMEFNFSDGTAAHARTVISAIRSGLLEGRGDSLLPGWSQSYVPSIDAVRRIK